MGHTGALMWLQKKKKKMYFFSVKLTCVKLREILRSSFEELEVYKPKNK